MNPIIINSIQLAKIIIPFPIKLFLRKVIWKFLYFRLKLKNVLRGKKTLNKVCCPISETYFDEFIPLFREYGNKLPSHKQRRISPDSGARDGLRLQWLFLKNETDLFKKNVSLLHIGPEYSFYTKIKAASNIDYFPVDKTNKKYSKDVGYADLTKLEFGSSKFDMIICNYVLEHVDDDIQAINEMYRVLKPGGTAIITVPIDLTRNQTYEDASITSPRDREREFGQWDHLRYYGLDFTQRLESAGFQVKIENYASTFSRGDFVKYGLADEPIFVCNKPLEV